MNDSAPDAAMPDIPETMRRIKEQVMENATPKSTPAAAATALKATPAPKAAKKEISHDDFMKASSRIKDIEIELDQLASTIAKRTEELNAQRNECIDLVREYVGRKR